MCQHDTFKIIYYDNGIMFRQCQTCRKIEMRLDWSWHSMKSIQDALKDAARREGD